MRTGFLFPSVSTSRGRRARIGAAAVVAVAAAATPLAVPAAGPAHAPGALGTAAVAAAHSVLVSTSPEQSSTVQESPQRVDLTFNEDIGKDFAHVTVMDKGKNVAEGEPQVEGRTVAIAVPQLSGGDYLVGYRVVSADGHPIQGSWTFTVAGGAAEPSAASASGTAQDPAPAQDSGSSTGQTIGAIALFGGLAVLLIGGAFVLLRRQKKMNEEYS